MQELLIKIPNRCVTIYSDKYNRLIEEVLKYQKKQQDDDINQWANTLANQVCDLVD
jgi:hypothetical protein